MRISSRLALTAILLTGGLAASRQILAAEPKPAETVAPKWVSLFNGKDLTGWKDVNTSPETWSVKDGLLVCSGDLPPGMDPLFKW